MIYHLTSKIVVRGGFMCPQHFMYCNWDSKVQVFYLHAIATIFGKPDISNASIINTRKSRIVNYQP